MPPKLPKKCTIPKLSAIKELETCLVEVDDDDECQIRAGVAVDSLREHGYTKLGSGIHRTVFAKPGEKCVIKLAANTYGATANFNEFASWKSIEKTPLEKFFAPIFKMGKHGSYVIMERAQGVGTLTNEHTRTLAREIEEAGIHCTDVRKQNVGRNKKGDPIVVDYGFGFDCHLDDESAQQIIPPWV